MKLRFLIRCSVVALALFMVSSCGSFFKSTATEVEDGYYRTQGEEKHELVYVAVEDERIDIYPTVKEERQRERTVDTSRVTSIQRRRALQDPEEEHSFSGHSLDVDFITAPLRYRPKQGEVPPQLTSNLNAAIYVGYRIDRYNVGYAADPLGVWNPATEHFGFSLGLITGIGSGLVNPTTTHDRLQIEYEGIVWLKGVAGIIAVNNFTAGLAVGFDNLLDPNRKYWIYENRPWVGLVLGLNLN